MPIEPLSRRIAGVIAAVPTPFESDGVDLDAFDRLCERLVNRGVAGLVPAGSTGEAGALSEAEYPVLVASAVGIADGRVPVIAGVGAPCTAESIRRAQAAEAVGADAILAAAPPYSRPTQAGLVAHFTAVHDATKLPLILYDVPSRAAVGLSMETIARLSHLPRVVGLKDASGDLTRPPLLRAAAAPGFVQLSGDDATFAAHLAQGGQGCISVVANVAPALTAALQAAWKRSDLTEMGRLRDLLAPLNAALFLESNPAPLKAALTHLGFSGPALRLPLVPVGEETLKTLIGVVEAVLAEEELCPPAGAQRFNLERVFDLPVMGKARALIRDRYRGAKASRAV